MMVKVVYFFIIPPCEMPFSENLFYFIVKWTLAQNYKFSNKNDLLCTWRDFKKIFMVDVDMVNETLSQKFHSYSILAG